MFSQKLYRAIIAKKTPLCVGLDPRLEWLPQHILQKYQKKYGAIFAAAAGAIYEFNRSVIETIAELVPVVKMQSAFYEQYGPLGMQALLDSITYAQKKGLLVIVDAKRGDIDSTAQAYANAFLGEVNLFGRSEPCYDADALTINPFLGEDSLMPFITACQQYGKGIFILVKTSNLGSRDIQDQVVGDKTISERVAAIVNKHAQKSKQDQYDYSGIGAVVGLQFPAVARQLRSIMPRSFFLVPGYGAQGGKLQNLKYFFNRDGLGAIINSSRKVIFSYRNKKDGEENYLTHIRQAAGDAIDEINISITAV